MLRRTMLVLLFLIGFLPHVAVAEIIVSPIRYEWESKDAPPWEIKIPGCDFQKLVKELELQLLHERVDTVAVLQVKSLYTEWNILRIRIERCPPKRRIGLQSSMAAAAFFSFTDDRISQYSFWRETLRENKIVKGLKLSFGFVSSSESTDPLAVNLQNGYAVNLEGILQWYIRDFPASLGDMKEIVFYADTWKVEVLVPEKGK